MNKARRGQVAIIAVFIILVFGFLALIVASLLPASGFAALANLRSFQALNVAEAGVRFTMVTSLAADANWANNVDYGPVNFGPGAFSVRYLSKETKNCTLEVTGTVQGVSRTVRVGLKMASGSGLPEAFDYGMYISPPGGGETLNIEGDARVYGDFLYSGPVHMDGSAQQLDGTIYSESISFGGTSSCASWEPIAAVEMPAWNNSTYTAITMDAMTSTPETLSLGWGQTLNLAGRKLFFRNVTIDWGATVTGPGTIVSTGVPSGNGDITINYGQGIGSNVRFVAKRDFIYQGGSNLTNSVEVYVGRQLRVLNFVTVPSGSILYSGYNGGNAIEINPGTVNRSIMLCPYGEFSFGGGPMIEGLVYGRTIEASSSGTFRGAIVCYGTSSLAGSLHVYFDPSFLPDAVEGLTSGSASGEFEVGDWGEVY